jgi:1,4-dihydroxy-2-naphthoate octaprenyltransferase
LSPLHIWLMAARPRTLPAAVAPVLVGTALAGTEDGFKVLTFLAAMLGALFIQVGTNLSTTPTRGAAPTPRTASGRCA